MTRPEARQAARPGARPDERPSLRRLTVEGSARLAFAHVLFAACLFGSAGTLAWPMAWAYLALSAIVTGATLALLARYDPDLLFERMRRHSDAKGWDKVLVPLVAVVLPIAMIVVAGLDHRFGWSPPLPLALQIAALAMVILGYAALLRTMLENTFFSPYVRIQTERGHRVVDTGPYALVRHPGYGVLIVADAAFPVALGSLWGLIPAAIAIAVLVLRTELEDRTLRRELAGYADYAKRVRYRLVPGMW